MGFFDFVSNMGKKLFTKPEEAADKIKREIESNNPGVENLKVGFKDGVVTLDGTATDAAALEKAVLMAGNVAGVTKVSVDNVTGAVLKDQVETYVIQLQEAWDMPELWS